MLESESNCLSQILCCGARVYALEHSIGCFSPDFSVSSSPVGTNSDFFDSQVKVDHSQPFLIFEFFGRNTHSCLKVVGGVGARVYVVAHKILVSASAPVPFWVYLDWNLVGLGWDWVGLKGWGLGLDNFL